jgi:hypothetical protein
MRRIEGSEIGREKELVFASFMFCVCAFFFLWLFFGAFLVFCLLRDEFVFLENKILFRHFVKGKESKSSIKLPKLSTTNTFYCPICA